MWATHTLNVRTQSHSHTDLNGTHFDTLEALPTALEFSQLVRISRPVLIRGIRNMLYLKLLTERCLHETDCPVPKALARWTDEYLAERCGDEPISVACTPNGYVVSFLTTLRTHGRGFIGVQTLSHEGQTDACISRNRM